MTTRSGTLAALRAAEHALRPTSDAAARYVAHAMVTEAIQGVEAEMNAALKRKAEKRRLKRQRKGGATCE